MTTYAAEAPETAGFTVLRAAHAALRRDLVRLAAAAAAGRADGPHIRAGWENFKAQLRALHEVEDTELWPRVARAVGRRPAETAVLAEVAAEHARLWPLVAEVDAALAGGGDLPGAVRDLRDALEAHLRHEERSALPLALSAFRRDEWRRFSEAARRRCGPRAEVFIPWVVDGMAPVERSRLLTALPLPVRERSRSTWEPLYRRLRLWSV